jgi:hypothetical protein
MSKKLKSKSQPDSESSTYSERLQIPYALGLSMLSCLVYFLTLYRTVPGGDSGELTQVAWNLGIAHPPGYPLFTLLAHSFTRIPFGTIAARVNFFSAVCDSIAAAFLVLTVSRSTRNTWAGMLAGGLFAFSPLIWTYATSSEVFALNNLFVSGLLYMVIRSLDESDVQIKNRLTSYSVFWSGLGLTNHHTFVFLAAPWVTYLIWTTRQEYFKPKSFLKLIGLFLLGLTPYLYLPVIDLSTRLQSWGAPSTWDGFLTHIFRREYGTFSLSSNHLGTSGIFLEILAAYIADLPQQFAYIGLFFIPAGWISAKKNKKSAFWTLFLSGTFCLYLWVFFSLSNLNPENPIFRAVLSRFWQQLDLILFFWVGIGFASVTHKFDVKKQWIVCCSLGLIALQIGLNFNSVNRSKDQIFRKLAYTTLNYLPKNALLLPTGDYVAYVFQHYQQAEGLRSDVQIIDQFMLTRSWYSKIAKKYFPEVTLPGERFSLSGYPGTYKFKEFFDANLHKFPIFIMNGLNYDDTGFQAKYTFWPIGLLDVVLPNDRELELDDWIQQNQKFNTALDPASLEKFPDSTWEHEILRQYWHRKHIFAAALINYSRKHVTQTRSIHLAISILEEVLNYPEFRTNAMLKNLGAAYEVLSLHEPQAKEKMVQTWKQYLEVANPRDPDLPTLNRIVNGR